MRDFYHHKAGGGGFWRSGSGFRRRQQQQQQQFFEQPGSRKFFRKAWNSSNRKLVQQQQGCHAPRNTSSFIMRAKDLGGIASLVSPNPTTPAVLATPDLSNAPVYKEVITDEVSKEWGVNGYGSMNGFIRLRPWEANHHQADTSESESEVDQEEVAAQSVQQLETNLNRFEMVYPANNIGNALNYNNSNNNSNNNNNSNSNINKNDDSIDIDVDDNISTLRMRDQESHIAHLEEENMTLRERLYVMEQEMAELRRRLEDADGMEEQAEVCESEN